MERIVIINESTFVKWTKSVERLQKLLESQEQQVSNRKTTEWIGTDEVCRMLGIGKRTVHAMRERGELPYSKLEHKIYFRTDDIIRLMDSHDSCDIPTANIQKISEKTGSDRPMILAKARSRDLSP